MYISAYLLDVLALELRDESGEALIISFDTDGFENALDVLGRGRGVTAEGEEEICCEVLHFMLRAKIVSTTVLNILFRRGA
jgi:hypothetical protein